MISCPSAWEGDPWEHCDGFHQLSRNTHPPQYGKIAAIYTSLNIQKSEKCILVVSKPINRSRDCCKQSSSKSATNIPNTDTMQLSAGTPKSSNNVSGDINEAPAQAVCPG